MSDDVTVHSSVRYPWLTHVRKGIRTWWCTWSRTYPSTYVGSAGRTYLCRSIRIRKNDRVCA